MWAKKKKNTTFDVKSSKNQDPAKEDKHDKTEGMGLGGRGQGSLRVLPSFVRASQEEDKLLGDMQDTFEPAVRRQRSKSIKLGSTELSLEGSGGKGQALFMKMAQTNPE